MLSVIIPVRNESDSLNELTEYYSKNLNNIDFEVLIVNDFSTDDTFEKAKRIWSDNKNFKILDNKKKGLGGAINLGIKEARGTFVAIMMADQSDDINDLLIYNSLMQEGNFDAILGSRFLKDSKFPIIQYKN